MHAHRVLGDGSWTRGPCPKSTNVARNKQAGVHGFELPLERPTRQENGGAARSSGSSNPWTPACLLRATFVLFGRFPLVHEPSPSTLSACMLFVCLFCLHVLYKAYFVVIPSKALDCGSRVKNGLIVNKTIVVGIACVVIPDVPQ